MSGWADRGHQLADAPPPLTRVSPEPEALVLDQLRAHRADAQRSPEQLRQAALLTRGPKSRAWLVLS